MRKKFLSVLLILFVNLCTFSQNSSQWRGPYRNGIYNETNLLKQWTAEGPKLLWHSDTIGDGFSSASVTEESIYVTGKKDTFDYLTAFDKEGNFKWQVNYGESWKGTFPDTRSTPTVVDNKIYVISGMGEVVCLNAITGEIIWKVYGLYTYDGKYGEWGVCESPLVFDNKVIYTPAGNKTTMIALDKENGKVIWESETIHDNSGYVSPILINYAGKKIIATVLAKTFIGVNADNGQIIWKYDYYNLENEKSLAVWYDAPLINTNSPVYKDGCIFITNGYDHVGAMFKLQEDGSGVELQWTTHVLDVHHGGVVTVNGFIFGANWLNNSAGNWCSIDWQTGNTYYEVNWKNKGSIIYADSMLYCFEERSGNIALVKPEKENFKVISSFRVPYGTGPYWAHPTLNDKILYIRHGKSLMAYNISEE